MSYSFNSSTLTVQWAALTQPGHWEFEIHDTATYTLRSSGQLPSSRLDYSASKALLDGGPWRDLKVKIWAVSELGLIGSAVEIQCVNASPSAPTVTLTATPAGLVAEQTICTDPDLGGYKFWGSTTNGFTPNDSTNLIYKGPNSRITIPNLTPGTPYYVKAAAFDVWGNDVNISSQVSATPNSVSASSVSGGTVSGLSTPIAIGDGGTGKTSALIPTDIGINSSGVPSTSSSSGTVGTIKWDSNYIYVCTASNTWKRASITTW